MEGQENHPTNTIRITNLHLFIRYVGLFIDTKIEIRPFCSYFEYSAHHLRSMVLFTHILNSQKRAGHTAHYQFGDAVCSHEIIVIYNHICTYISIIHLFLKINNKMTGFNQHIFFTFHMKSW